MMEFFSRSLIVRYVGIIFLLPLSCTIDASLLDVQSMKVDMDFQQNTFTNKNQFSFKVTPVIPVNIKKVDSSVAVYDSENCSGPALRIVRQADLTSIAVDGLEDGHKYSFQVILEGQDRSFQSQCTPWVGIDQQAPPEVPVLVPATNGYVTQKKMQARWQEITDNGISGLAEKPYVIELYSGPACGGTLVQSIQTDSIWAEFLNLDSGGFYSFKVQAWDKAGNLSPLSCSPSTEIDLFAPGFSLTQTGSDVGFSNSPNVGVSTVNDSWVVYWCLTQDLSFRPSSISQACPAGQGDTNGWHSSRPTTYNLGSVDGLKSVMMVTFSDSGDVRTNKQPVVQIELDRIAPGAFGVLGITGGTDNVVDAFLSQMTNPIVHWSSSSSLKNYLVEIFKPDSSLACSKLVYSSIHQVEVEGCQLQNSMNYRTRVTAKDFAGNQTVTADFSFRLDLQPPGSFTISGVGGVGDSIIDSWAPGIPRVYWTESTDAIAYDISIKDAVTGNILCADAPVSAPSLDYDFNASSFCAPVVSGGSYVVTARSQDAATLFTTASNNLFLFRVDLDIPQITIDSKPAALSDSTEAVVNFSTADLLSGIQSVECSLNAASWSACSSPYSLNSLGQGHYQWRLKVVDNVGNQNIATEDFIVDLNPPAVTITSAPLSYVAATTAEFNFTATDSGSAGVNRIECNLDGAGFSVCTSPAQWTALAEGLHTLDIRAFDNLEHVSPVVTHSWSIDSTAPTLSWDSTPSEISTSTSPSYEFSYADAASGVQSVRCKLDSASYSACTSPRGLSGLSHGLHTFSVQVTDNVGNVSTITDDFFVDIEGPAVLVTSSPANYDISTSATFVFAASDSGTAGVALIECRLDAGAWTSCTSPATYSGLALGNHQVQIRATDSVGNTGAAVARSWIVDNTAPLASLTSTPTTGTTSTTASVSFTSSDPQSGLQAIECRWNSGAWAACTSPASRSGLSVGSNQFEVRVTNNVGLATTLSHSWTINYGYTWQTSGWGSCSASPYWGSFGGCSASCGYGTQYRACYNTSGSQSRSVWCLRSDGATVSDSFCGGGRPTGSTSCYSSCSGSDSRSCYAGACYGYTGYAYCTPYSDGPCAGSCGGHSGCDQTTWYMSGTAIPGGCQAGHSSSYSYGATSYTCYGPQ